MEGRVTCLSVTVWTIYLSYSLPMKIWIHIPRCPLLHMEGGSHRIYMTTANGMTLTTLQALVPTFLLTFIPDQMISLGPYYQRHNTRLPASPFHMMWPSPSLLLMINSSSMYWNLTPVNLTIIMAPLHLLQPAPLYPTIYMLTHLT